VGAPTIYQVLTLPPWSTLGCVVLVYPSLGAPAIWFGRCRVWALLDGDDLYSSAHVCWVVSIIRHSGFYAQSGARTHELQVDLAETGSGIVEAGCFECFSYEVVCVFLFY